MKQNNIWSIAFEACTREILKEVCWSNGPHWILHAQTGTRFKHRSTKSNPIVFNLQGTIYQSIIISTTLNPTQSVSNSFISFWQKIYIIFQWQSVWNVVYAVQIECRDCWKLLINGKRPL
jgi:hypothetical protein